MKVEMTVDWNSLPNEDRHDSKPRAGYPKIPTSRAERRLYFMALGREIEAAVRSGKFASLAEVARVCNVSRARVSQVATTNNDFAVDTRPR